jgi:hypothetical protein
VMQVITAQGKDLKKLSKALPSLDWYLLFEFIFTLKSGKICRMEFQVKLTENLISEYHITEERTLGRPPYTGPPTTMNAPQCHCSVDIGAVLCVMSRNKVQLRKLLGGPACFALFPALPYGGRLLEGRKRTEVQQVAKKCLKVRV